MFSRYQRANAYLNEGLIRTTWPEPRPGPRPTRRDRMRRFLPRLGHPERAFPAIHIGGTSGKGSTAIMVAEMLRAAGVRTGLHVTPYLQVATEKLWVDGRYASVDEFAALIDWVRPHADAAAGPDVPMHGMASVAIFLEHFRRQRVDVGVVEVGVGGRNDITRIVDTRVAVISAVGADHMKTLGPTLSDVAWHKAGIITPGCRAVALEGVGLEAARRQADAVGAPLRVVGTHDFRWRALGDGRGAIDFIGRRLRLDDVPLAMPGRCQGDNAALALAAVEELSEAVDADAARTGLARARLPGRMEWLDPNDGWACPVLLDGAHNPDKVEALVDTTTMMGRRRIHLIYGGLASHARTPAIGQLAARATTVIATEPRVYAKTALPASELAAEIFGGLGVTPHVVEAPDAALDYAVARAEPDDVIVVAGSLYLAGELRGRAYAPDRVLDERRSWF